VYGSAFFVYNRLMQPFSKPFLPVPAQIALLKARGLTITDDGRATW
jgi:hypothetical protein